MKILKELDVILSANDRYEFDEFQAKLKKCALVGHDFKMCIAMIHASYDSGINIDGIIMMVGKLGIRSCNKIKSEYLTAEEVLKDIAKHFYDGSDGIEWCWQERTSLESRGEDKLARALRPYLEDK